MFRRKTAQESPSQPAAQAASTPTYSGGYQVVELPTYDKGKRKVVVYRSDSAGRIVKSFKR